MSRIRRCCRVLVLACLAAPPAFAAVEEVTVTRAREDELTIQRGNGERWRLDVRQSCPWGPGFVGRRVLIHSQAAILRSESKLLAPEFDLECRIWHADSTGRVKVEAAPEPPTRGLEAMREALELLGYPCGTESGWTPDAAQAFLRFRESRKLETVPRAVRKGITALAIDVLKGRQTTGTAMRLSRTIADEAPALEDYLERNGGATGATGCGELSFIRARSEDGTRVTLGDGTIWEPVAPRRSEIGSWDDNDGVIACGGRLVNARTGAMVKATRLR